MLSTYLSADTEQQVKQRVQQLQSDIGSLQTWLKTAQSQASDIQQQLQKSEKKNKRPK